MEEVLDISLYWKKEDIFHFFIEVEFLAIFSWLEREL
jgi:hypothetical protein